MAFKADVRDILFVLTEYLDIDTILSVPLFRAYCRDDIVMILEEAGKLASEIIAPLNKVSDRCGATFEKKAGVVKTPPGFKEAFELYTKGGWGSSTVPSEYGGQGLPEVIGVACSELFTAACCSFTMASGLSKAAANVLIHFGTGEQKKRYAIKMLSGEWTGTMCLTEPQAGSDVGAVKTMATPIEGRPGIYSISGNKNFISFGEHDLTKNIVHLVLARTPGAPTGTKGISLFVVPKFRLNADGSVSEKANDVVCGGIEHKMGIHGSPTCTMLFGENSSCEGELVGEINAGMKYMFLMMNEERLMVGMQGHAIASASYQAALAFAQERIQGSSTENMKDPAAKKVAIINHPDVRRMLMTMKAHVEGMRALLYTTAFCLDMAHNCPDQTERRKYSGWVELLTPICKAFCTDTAFHVAELGIQVHGGYGYCTEYPTEQYLRDCKITSIYEGTNGIQALDLLGRKLNMGGGAVLMGFVTEINAKIEKIKRCPAVAGLVPMIEKARDALAGVLMRFMDPANAKLALVNACALLEMFGTVICSVLLAEQATIAANALEMMPETSTAENAQTKFFKGKLATAAFYANTLLPRVFWRTKAIENGDLGCLSDVF